MCVIKVILDKMNFITGRAYHTKLISDLNSTRMTETFTQLYMRTQFTAFKESKEVTVSIYRNFGINHIRIQTHVACYSNEMPESEVWAFLSKPERCCVLITTETDQTNKCKNKRFHILSVTFAYLFACSVIEVLKKWQQHNLLDNVITFIFFQGTSSEISFPKCKFPSASTCKPDVAITIPICK